MFIKILYGVQGGLCPPEVRDDRPSALSTSRGSEDPPMPVEGRLSASSASPGCSL